MEALQQKCRPKHQVLVLKCYPRTTKGAVDVKANSSELSYLLFYALSRRSKIQKIGTFLEKKTAKDVWRLRIGNVQVTLQILAALVEKSAKDVTLIAPCVLTILDTILRSNDITMVESSIPTFAAFCEHHDASSLFADQAYLRQYEGVVRAYASLASTSTAAAKGPGPVTTPVALRWRNVGLQAVMALVSSDALASVPGRQLDVAVPMVLENLWTENQDLVEVLQHRLEADEKKHDADLSLQRRTSNLTVRTTEDGCGDPNPIALSGTAFDVDKLAEEDIGVLAMHCLKQIFVIPNRPQILYATTAMLEFLKHRVALGDGVAVSARDPGTSNKGWGVRMLEMAARWAPVQDRYVILVTTMDRLSKTPVQDDSLQWNFVLVSVMGSLLRSDVNLIGLSVMDVLLGLISHIKKTIQLPGGVEAAAERGRGETVTKPRRQLLERLQQCIGELATHVYYADQISDMIATILLKLKPPRPTSAASTPRGENTEGPAGPADPDWPSSSIDAYFAQSLGKVSALRAIKSILLIANPQTKLAGNLDLSRNRVPIQVWEGTQWLLRDPDGAVRRAYSEALLAWLDRETIKADSRAVDETRPHRAAAAGPGRDFHPVAPVARRAVSSASNRERPAKGSRSHFLPLLHLAIYDNALQHVDHESDFVLLHILLSRLVLQLGVNAVRYGLPMIFRLQEEILDAEAPVHKIRLGSLCHGYFWTLTEKFEFEDSSAGQAIHNEISRRRSKSFWVDGIRVPPPALELASAPGAVVRSQLKVPLRAVASEALLPFDDRRSLVDCVVASYRDGIMSPPTSPAASPGRSVSVPMLGGASSIAPMQGGVDRDNTLPSHFGEQMLSDWTRDATLACVQEGTKSESLSGSRSGTTATRNRLGMYNGLNGSAPGLHPSLYGGSQPNLNPLLMSKIHKTSVRSGVSPSLSVSSRGGVASVEQLKLVLSGSLTGPALGTLALAAGHEDDSGSDSLVSYDSVPSELSSMPPAQPPDGAISTRPSRASLSRDKREGGSLSSHAPADDDGISRNDMVPPVPPLPSLPGTMNQAGVPGITRELPASDHHHTAIGRQPGRNTVGGLSSSSSRTRPDSNGVGPGPTTSPPGVMDLLELLRGISAQGDEGSIGAVTKPPY